ncbi:hypothetical protein BKA69DRAFT_1048639 [Paraphysoderma sedebokerense]|nr:hypothetical protein BKA69DRAFT_1048639 [Paraphysoderma sedebokerense]
MPLFAEKRIIESLDFWIRKNKYEPTEEESKCLRSYSKSMLISGAATLSIFTFIGYKSLDFKALFGPSANRNIFQNLLVPLTAISGGAFITTYYVARNATTDCLQCLLNLESFNSALAKVTEDE